MKYQTPCDELQWEVSVRKKMSTLCPGVSYHLSPWTLTDVLPTPFISCVSASPGNRMEGQEGLSFATRTALTLSGGCVRGEWDTCVVSSFANSGGSEGQRGRRVHDTQPPAGLKARGNLMLN